MVLCKTVDEFKIAVEIFDDLANQNDLVTVVKFKNMFGKFDIESKDPDLNYKDVKYIFRVEWKGFVEFIEMQVIFYT